MACRRRTARTLRRSPIKSPRPGPSLRMGGLHRQSLHTRLGLAVKETEPLLLRDFANMLERFARVGGGYEHDDFARRVDVALDEPINGHAHVRQLLLTGFATLLV